MSEETPRGRPAKMFPVKLFKNYRPASIRYNILDATKGTFAGVGQEAQVDTKGNRISAPKIWAGSVVELPIEEAKKLMGNKVPVFDHTRNNDGEKIIVKTMVSMPLAERADEIPVD